MKNQNVIFLVCAFFSSMCFGKEYVLFGNAAQEYRTLSEKEKLFKSMNRAYGNKIMVSYQYFNQLDVAKSRMKELSIEVCRGTGPYQNEIIAGQLAPTYVQWVSPEIGYGLFADEDLEVGTFIGSYAGTFRAFNPKGNETVDDLAYAWSYPLLGVGNYPLLIDAKYYGNELSLVNYSAHSNVRAVYYLINGLFVLCYIAIRDIAKNEELTVDYGPVASKARTVQS